MAVNYSTDVLDTNSFAAALGDETRSLVRWLGQPSSRMKIVLALLVLYAIAINAWVSEDAYITFRSIDQLNAGNGPRWNPHERVQAFTHPLWFGLLSIFSHLIPNLFFASIVLGALCTICALLIFWASLKRMRGIPIAVLGILTFISSKAIMDYSTSGLENPLSYLLLAAVLLTSHHWLAKQQTKYLFAAHTCIFLLAVNRLDSLSLTLPVMVWLLISSWKLKGATRAMTIWALASVPLAGWQAFSLIYYGFPFPNTAYAKVFQGLGPIFAIPKGVWYLVSSAGTDPLILAIPFAVLVGLRSRDPFAKALSWGITLNLGYILWIGGDYMAGRFLTLSIVTALFLILSKLSDRHLARGALFLLVFLAWPLHPLNPFSDHYTSAPAFGVLDERAFSSSESSLEACLVALAGTGECPDHPWIWKGQDFARSDRKITVTTAMGMFGWVAGLDKIIVDRFALTDPLLARIPTDQTHQSRSGHLSRPLPAGYLKSLETGLNRVEDPYLSEYYGHLRTITQAPIFSRNRFRTILNFNLGRYDYLLDKYLAGEQ
jgi:arabinofuranosyltransferase